MTAFSGRKRDVALAAFLVLGIALVVTAGYFAALGTIAIAPAAIALLALAGREIAKLSRSIGRLELAWLFVLSGTLSIDTLSVEQVFAGGIQRAQAVRLIMLAIASVLVWPNVWSSLQGRRRGLHFGQISTRFGIYVLIGLLSSVWSLGKLATLGKAAEVAVALLIVAAIAATPNAQSGLKRLGLITLLFMGAILGFVLIGYLVDSSTFSRYVVQKGGTILSGGPVPIASNAIARHGAIISTISLLVGVNPRYRWAVRLTAITAAVVAACCPVMAEGRTGIVALILGWLVVLAKRTPRVALITYPAFGSLLLMSSYIESFWRFFRRGQSDELFWSLSGRVDWWQSGWEVIVQSPWIGHGFGVGGRAAFALLGREETSGLHNGFLEVAAGVGVVGLLPWLWTFIVVTFGALRRLAQSQAGDELFAAVIAIFLATALSSGAGGWMSPELGLYLIMIALLEVPSRKPAVSGAGIG